MADNIANKVLTLNEKWEHTDKTTIAENVEKHLYSKFPECSANWSVKVEKISEITGSKPDTVFAWFNRGRPNVKVPFLKLCKIADYLGSDVAEFFKQTEN